MIKENVSLAPLTTLRVGGSARFFMEATSNHQLESAVSFAQSKSIPLFVLGGGSNLLVSDKGYPGLVIQMKTDGVGWNVKKNKGIVSVAAGQNWSCRILPFILLT